MSARPKPKASADNCETCNHPRTKHKDVMARSMKRCEICGRLVFFNRLDVSTWDENTNKTLMHFVDDDFLTGKEKAFVLQSRLKDGTLIGKETFHIKCYKAHYPEHAIPP